MADYNSRIHRELLFLAAGIIWLHVALSVAFDSHTKNSKCRLTNSSHGVTANCQHLGLTEVPQDLPMNVTELDVSFNSLIVLPNDSFQNVPNVITLSLHFNTIFSIQSRTFWPLRRLRILLLHFNVLVTIPRMAFVKNTLLTKLLLEKNNFTEVPHEALSAAPHLLNFEFSYNKIKSINFEGCSRWSHLGEINLFQNEVTEIHQDDFLPLQNTTVNSLSLTSNKVQVVQPHSFLHLKALQTLNLDGNQIDSFDIKPFLGMSYINFLSVYGSQINELLPPHSSSNLSSIYPTILTLNIAGNRIESVPEGAFWGFTTLKVLNFKYNKITTVTNRSFCHLESLVELEISNNKLAYFPNGTFACLHSLVQLNASGNLLQYLSPGYFYGMPSVLKIFLASNRIEKLNNNNQLWKVPTLRVLDISDNILEGVSKERFAGLSRLEALNISRNIINYYSTNAFSDLLNLKELHLAGEASTFLQDIFQGLHQLLFLDLSNAPMEVSRRSITQFTGMTSLSELRMEKAQLKDVHLYDNENNQSLFTGLSSLNKLRLKENLLYDLDVRVFGNLSQLYYLDMSNSRIRNLRSGLFKPLSSLTYLYLNDNKLIELAGDLFNGLFLMRVVSLQNNILSSLDPKTFAPTPHLTDLYIPGNQISTIKPGTVIPANNSLRFDISKNPFSCTCSLAWFRRWLDNADIDFKHADQTLCSGTSLKGLTKQPIMSFHPDDYCGVNIFLIVSLSLSGIFLCLMTMLAYTKRWWLNHKLFLLKLAVVGYEEMAEDFDADNYEFHLNLMFHEAEEEWVDEVMKPALEERFPHLRKILYGDKDLHLGMFYINAIYDALESSFKTVLLISNQSITDAWCMTKLRMSLEHLNETELDKVILVFVEDIDDDHLPYLVRLFLSRNKPYMLWTDDEDGQELFWAQFERSMRANKAINNAIPL